MVKNKIQQFINKLGISIYEFRKRTGVAQRTAYDLYHNPAQIPNGEVLGKICDAFEIQPGEILEWIKEGGVGEGEESN